jgi:hypothetical protein
MSALGEFGNIAIRLARNPLGIIALLIVLVYAIAGFVATSDNFQPPERQILVWFLVLFPILVVVALVYLVTQHHTKLYAPSDFANPEHFVQVFESQIEKSPKVRELEAVMREVQSRIDNQPLYRYTKLSEEGKLVTLLAVIGDPVDFLKLVKDRNLDTDEMKRQISVLEGYGWIEVRDNKACITEKGSREIMTFNDLAYGRLK